MKILPLVAIFVLSAATASAQPGHDQPVNLFGNAKVEFAQTSFDFNTQGIGRPNCINIPIVNKTGEVQRLVDIYSSSEGFSVSSPSDMMLPIEIQPGGTLYASLCFRPMEERNYSGVYVAKFEKDSSVMTVTGGGMKVEPIRIPTRDTLRVIKKKEAKNQYIFEVDLSTQSKIELIVSDALGNELKSYTFGEIKYPGPYRFNFNGVDKQGNPLDAGTYYVKLETINYKGSKSFPIEGTPKRKQKPSKSKDVLVPKR